MTTDAARRSTSTPPRAAERLAPWVHRTPVLSSRTLDGGPGGSVLLKCENFQKVGAFKFRGAMNAVLQLDDAERARGRRHPLLGQPRPGPGPGRAVARRAGLRRHAADGPGDQAGRHRGLRRHASSPASRPSPTARPTVAA